MPTRGNINPIVTRSGEEREIEWHDQTLRDERGNVVSVLAIGQDVTVRVRMQSIERESQLRLQNIFDGMLAFIGLYTPEGMLIEVNRVPLEAAGVKREDVIGKPFWDAYWWSYSPQAQEHVRTVLRRAAQGETVRDDFQVRVADEQFIIVDGMFSPLRDETGRITQIISSGIDISDRKRIEQALRTSEDRLNEAQRIAQIGSWELDLVSGKLAWSEEIFRLFEIDKTRFGATYEAFLDAIHPEDLEAVNAAYTRSLETRAPYETTHRLRMADGRIKHVIERCELEFDAGGKPLKSVGTVQDITERKLADEALAESHRLLKAIIDTSPVRIFWKDRELRFLGCNPVFARDAGKAHPDDLLGKDDYQMSWKVQAEIYRADDRQVMDSGVAKLAYEEPQTTPDGQNIWLRTSKVPLRNEKNEIIGVLGIYEDVTEGKLAEQQARRLSNILEGSLNEIYVFDADSLNFVLVNQGARTNLGYTMEDLRKLTPMNLKPEYSPVSFAALVAPLRSGAQRLIRFSTVHRRKDGSIYPVEIHLQMFSDDSPPVFVAVVIDITERKRAEAALNELNSELDHRVKERTAKLEAVNKELETFTYTVSHDLKAPLRGIDGYSRLLLENHSDRLDDEGRDFLANVRRATQHMGQLIEDLLAYSRLERRDMQSGKVDARALIEGVLAQCAVDISARGVTVSVAVPFSSMTADRDGLAMTLRNLLENALKFTGNVPQPKIEIGGRDTGNACILSVRDNGVGFDMKFHDRIFDIFQRLHRSEDYPGTGVGLAIVRKAMQRMGGRAWAESEPGQGATFYLELPK